MRTAHAWRSRIAIVAILAKVNRGANNLYILHVQVAQPVATTTPDGGMSTLDTSTSRP
jgi:hypothetical protein